MLENGYAMFDEQHKGTGDIVPVDCVEGYNIVGGHSTTCLADGSWSKAVQCRIKGLLLFFATVNTFTSIAFTKSWV